MVGGGSQGWWWLDGGVSGSDGGCPCVASCVAVALLRLAPRIQSNRAEGVEARVDNPIQSGKVSCGQG
jgi:hypothetical protein